MAEDGASLIEYALLLALIALVCIVSLQFFGSARDRSFSKSGSALQDVVIAYPPPLRP